ncbi:MAG: MFS transporter [Acidimicrobiia bacterium]|nr:MFS transporter [Acidimicrobiia bacterium]
MTSADHVLFARRARYMGAGVFVLTVGIFFRTPLVVEMAREFELSALAVGALSSAFALGRLVTDLPAGRAADRFPLGLMMAVAAAVVAIGSAVMARSPVAAVLYAGSFVLGVGSASILTASFAFFATAPRARRGHYLSLFAAAMLVGQALGPAAGGLISSRVQWRATLAFGALIAVLISVAFAGVKTLRTEPAKVSGSGGPDSRATAPVLVVIYLLPAVQFGIGAALYQTLLPLVGAQDLGFSTALIGVGLGVGGIARFVAALVAGRVSDTVSRKAALLPGLVLQLAGVLTFGLVSSTAGWWLAVLLLTFGSVVVNVGSTMLADLSEGARLGRRLGSFRFSGDAAFLVAPLLTGGLFERFGRLAAAAPLVALVVTALVGVVLIVPETLAAPD